MMNNRMADDHLHLIKQIAAKNELAMSQFYDQFNSIIYNFALKRMREPADAAEVLNQVMLEVWRTASRFEGRSKVQTWVLSITHHKIIDSLRKTGRHEGEEIPENLEAENQQTQLDAVALSENTVFIKRCLEKLSEQHREIIHLAFYEDMIYSEIAMVIDRPEGTVKTRMYYAKIALKKCLEKLLKNDDLQQ